MSEETPTLSLEQSDASDAEAMGNLFDENREPPADSALPTEQTPVAPEIYVPSFTRLVTRSVFAPKNMTEPVQVAMSDAARHRLIVTAINGMVDISDSPLNFAADGFSYVLFGSTIAPASVTLENYQGPLFIINKSTDDAIVTVAAITK